MNCNGNSRCDCSSAECNCVIPSDRTIYDCNADRKVVRHQHIIKHRHDIINEFDVIHEHDYYYRDVVSTRDVVKHHDYTPYNPEYCGGGDCGA
ncbi:MAG: hypothetical protein FWH07_04725 [Oscillospiraceae bacterium]|nr:hypothetical protein [Oscillospiraceae bacterium]